MSLKRLYARWKDSMELLHWSQQFGCYPYFRVLAGSNGTEVEVDGKRLIMAGSNDYLGLSHHPLVLERAAQAARQWGSATGGSRFLCGNLSLHQQLEERLADFVGKKRALVHVTGFSTNLGAIMSMLMPGDRVLCDRESHASILEACQASRARLRTFAHNDPESADARLSSPGETPGEGVEMLITEGVFSMSGDVAPLPELAALKKNRPNLLIYLDDAHGLGVMGPGGRGTAAHFGLTGEIDFIMGTFSKALASIGGFIACDDDDVMEGLRHNSRTLIFSAALPASNTAAVLAALDVMEEEPQRVKRLWEVTARARKGYAELGLDVGPSQSPILPIRVGPTDRAAFLARDLFEQGVFAPLILYPAVPKDQALLRTSFSSAHSDQQVDRVLEALEMLVPRYGLGKYKN